ncbi:uncharacterized protein UTRI_04298_B [Ustilago trichophora]|uniref:pectinesterase n=1 Tax=Ustilago trichophora TaxID=86804 RepID=A0A5C3ECA0_9BASI|nr:uncharacterized protein UTRI_04298_B [Ustilago trichophora]
MLSRSYIITCLIGIVFLSNSSIAAPIIEEDLHHTTSLDSKCQEVKNPLDPNPLQYCPRGSVFVSQKHPAAQFKTITSALEALPDDGSSRTVLIDEGIYHEKVVIGRVSPTIFAGVTSEGHNPYSNRVSIWQSSYVNQSDPHNTMHNCDAVVLGVGTLSPLGASDFKAYNIDFTQRQFFEGKEVTEYQLGPAAALCVVGSNASFYSCGFSSYQDTIYVGSSSQAFFFKSIVKGMTDQLYGAGKAWFERVTLLSRACGGGITAWRGDPTDPLIGVYISNSEIKKSPDASTRKKMEGKCHLGRPWNVHSHATYLSTKMSNIIADAGFRVWGKEESNFDPKLTHFEEWNSSGEGGNMAVRDYTLEKALTEHEAKQITYRHVFGGEAKWIDEKPIKEW